MALAVQMAIERWPAEHKSRELSVRDINSNRMDKPVLLGSGNKNTDG
jgi:hypothetical protein